MLYDRNKYRAGLELACRIARRTPVAEVVIVWNGQGDPPPVTSELEQSGVEARVIRGSNFAREFGGYQEGVAGLRHGFDRGIFVFNETAGTHGYLPGYFVRKLVDASIAPQHPPGICIGYVWEGREKLRIKDLESSSWIQSHLFYVDRTALRMLDWTIYCPDVDTLISEVADEKFFDPQISATLRARLTAWLFKPGWRAWYAAAPLTSTNARFMAAKARSILQEHYFAMRLRSRGVQIIHPDLNIFEEYWMKLGDVARVLARFAARNWVRKV